MLYEAYEYIRDFLATDIFYKYEILYEMRHIIITTMGIYVLK